MFSNNKNSKQKVPCLKHTLLESKAIGVLFADEDVTVPKSMYQRDSNIVT